MTKSIFDQNVPFYGYFLCYFLCLTLILSYYTYLSFFKIDIFVKYRMTSKMAAKYRRNIDNFFLFYTELAFDT